jgi:hypothetical protein
VLRRMRAGRGTRGSAGPGGRRAARRWTAAPAVAAAGALALTGCGQTQLGAAALYSNQRISTAKLTAEVKNLNAAYQADKAKLNPRYPPAEMPRQVLNWMLRFATADQVAKRLGISFTPAFAQRQADAEKASVRQSGDTLPEAAVLSGLPPDLLPELGRYIAIQVKLQKLLDHGVVPTTNAEQQVLLAKITHVNCLAAKSMHIKVNPQYGGYDYRQLAVVPVPNKLSANPGRGNTHSPAPQLTPKC